MPPASVLGLGPRLLPEFIFLQLVQLCNRGAFSWAERPRACTHAEQQGCREGSRSHYRALIEMPSVTALAFNYLTCWQLEAGKQAGKKRRKGK